MASRGATVPDSAAEAVRGADVMLTMVWDADAVADTITAAAPGLAPGTVWLQTSTVGVQGTERLAELAGEHGLIYVDSPVLGTKQPAEQGQLVVLAAGPARARAVADPVFDAIGGRTLWVGDSPGSASALKLVVNSWLATVAEGVAEALTASRVLGLDPALFLDAVRGGTLDAPYLEMKGRAMLEGRFEPSFTVSGGAKDVGLALDAVRAAGLAPDELAVFESARARLDMAVADGYGDLDIAATYLSHQPSQPASFSARPSHAGGAPGRRPKG
jgi:3-hydroxyisobutyrate dehydrogenase